MMQMLRDFWGGLSSMQRTVIIVAVIALVFAVWASYAFLGTDYAGFGDWLRSWFGG